MADPINLEALVEQAVRTVLDNHLPALREQLVREVKQTVEPQLAGLMGASPPAKLATSPAQDSSSKLNDALLAVQAGKSQVEILDAMLDGASKFANRTALYVVRGANAVGWRARGFNDNDGVRTSPIELGAGLAAKAIEARAMVGGEVSELGTDFGSRFGTPTEAGVMLPLMVRDKAVALIYADGGTEDDQLDYSALEALVRTSGLWLEVFATRKATGTALPAVPPSRFKPPAAKVMAASSGAPAAVAVAQTEAAPVPIPITAPEPAPASAQPVPSGEEGEIHKKARRFAKLLVDEIKLYNQAKVTEGRQNRDLYDRLKDDIEKSRASYDKRYGESVAKTGDYFNQELIRILADSKSELLGHNFKR